MHKQHTLNPLCTASINASFARLSNLPLCTFVKCSAHRYHNPSKGANMTTWFVAREMAHAASVCRRFYWTKLNLWPDQLPRHTLVVLSERDELVAVRVRLACDTVLDFHEERGRGPDDMS